MKIAPGIEAEPDRMSGKPCIRGTRIRVTDVLHLLASGMSREEILDDYPSLQPGDFDAALLFAAEQVDRPFEPARAIAAE